jgi:hypothetical protein
MDKARATAPALEICLSIFAITPSQSVFRVLRIMAPNNSRFNDPVEFSFIAIGKVEIPVVVCITFTPYFLIRVTSDIF